MRDPARQSLFAYPRTTVGFPEKIAAVATLIVVAQAVAAFAAVAVLSSGFAWVFVIAGLISFFGSLCLAIWRKSLRWTLAFAASLLCWLAAFAVAHGMAISRMH